jgi:hypothetical protein
LKGERRGKVKKLKIKGKQINKQVKKQNKHAKEKVSNI